MVATVVVATPSNVVAVPAVNLRGGDMITLKGTNMDLVTDVTFPGVEEAVGLESQNSTEIKVLMPAAAISGDLQLNTNSGKQLPYLLQRQSRKTFLIVRRQSRQERL